MPVKRKPPQEKRTPAWTKTVGPKAFASLDAGPSHVETMIHVYWSGYRDARDARDGNKGHLMQRDKITANLGFDQAIEPGFSPDEIQAIAYAAKMAALKCLRERACGMNYAEGAHCGRKKNHKGPCRQFDREL